MTREEYGKTLDLIKTGKSDNMEIAKQLLRGMQDEFWDEQVFRRCFMDLATSGDVDAIYRAAGIMSHFENTESWTSALKAYFQQGLKSKQNPAFKKSLHDFAVLIDLATKSHDIEPLVAPRLVEVYLNHCKSVDLIKVSYIGGNRIDALIYVGGITELRNLRIETNASEVKDCVWWRDTIIESLESSIPILENKDETFVADLPRREIWSVNLNCGQECITGYHNPYLTNPTMRIYTSEGVKYHEEQIKQQRHGLY